MSAGLFFQTVVNNARQRAEAQRNALAQQEQPGILGLGRQEARAVRVWWVQAQAR